MTLVKYDNLMANGQRNRRWTTKDAKKYQNLQMVDYYQKDLAETMEEAYRDMFALYVNGKYGEYNYTPAAPVVGSGLSGGGTSKVKVGDGMFPFMQKYGAINATTNAVTLEADFKACAFLTDYEAAGEPRWVVGTPRALHRLTESWKDPVTYAPSDTTSKLDLQLYDFGGMKFVPVPVSQFEEAVGIVPPAFANRLMVVNPNSFNPTCMTGYEPITMFNTASLSKSSGGYNDFVDWAVPYMIGFEMTTVGGSFWLDII
jgi:hypothetical protein